MGNIFIFAYMKRYIPVIMLLGLMSSFAAGAWGTIGHRVTIEIAQRYLSETAKRNISAIMPYDMKKDAVWMDAHRRDSDIAYTTAFHVYNVNPQSGEYDPTVRFAKGDCVRALVISDYVLRHRHEYSDSVVLMNLRMMIHFIGDLHCPTHSYLWEPGGQKWPCMLCGKKFDTFHSVYDKMPGLLYPGQSDQQIADLIDDASKRERGKIAKGSFLDWVKLIGVQNAYIYEINPAPEGHRLAPGVDMPVLDPDTVEKSRNLCNMQMRNAGYRLARLLNEYFGE